MSTERARALRELDQITQSLTRARAELERLEGVRDRRIMRAVALGATRPECAERTGLSRQRVQQITQAIERGSTSRDQVRELAKQPTPRLQVRGA